MKNTHTSANIAAYTLTLTHTLTRTHAHPYTLTHSHNKANTSKCLLYISVKWCYFTHTHTRACRGKETLRMQTQQTPLAAYTPYTSPPPLAAAAGQHLVSSAQLTRN